MVRIRVLLLVAFFAIAEAALVGKRESNRHTKLHRTHSLGEYERSENSKAFKGEPFSRRPSPEPKILGKGEKARELIKQFLDKGHKGEGLSTVFLVKSSFAREVASDLGAEKDSGVSAVLILDDASAATIFDEVLGTDTVNEQVKAVMLMSTGDAKDILADLIVARRRKGSIKVVILGDNERARQTLRGLLDSHTNEELNLALIDKYSDVEAIVEKVLEKKAMSVLMVGEKDRATVMIDETVSKEEGGITIVYPVGGNRNPSNETPSQVPSPGVDENVKVIFLGEDGKELDADGSPLKEVAPTYVSSPFNGEDPKTGTGPNSPELDLSNKDPDIILEELTVDMCKTSNFEIEAARHEMANLVASVKIFIHDNSFDFRGFEAGAYVLEKRLSDVEHSVRSIASCDENASKDFSFLKEMFLSMANSLEPLKYYGVGLEPGHYLVKAVIDLNIRLLALTDERGVPNPKLKDYGAKITRYSSSLEYWGDEFSKYASASYGMSQMFWRQFQQAETVINVLSRQQSVFS